MEEYLNFFNNYTKHYMQIAKNDFQKVHINRKIEHSKRVNKFSIEIAKELKLEENEQYIINIASLLHDIGRFEQFYKYSTYVDKDSVNHALLGCQILEEKQILTSKEKESINPFKILEFTKSEIWQEVKRAKEIYQEKPFYIYIPAKEVYGKDTDEYILVQGIIDLYYISDNDELVLVDYKTDYVEKGNEKALLNKYDKQLELYQRALEEALQRKVDRKFVYSVYLGKALEEI